MQPTLCTRCKKNLAVVFVTRLENGEARNEGLCLKCARSLGIKPVDDMIKKMELFGNDSKGLYSLDAEYAARIYTAPSLTL